MQIPALEKLMDQIKGSPEQKKFDRLQKLWYNVISNPDFSIVLEHMNNEIGYLQRVLETKDDADVRAEIRVYRKILQISENYANNIDV